MKRFDTLFARLFLMQVVVATLLVLMLALLLFDGQSSVLARATAPAWAAALRPLQAQIERGEPTLLPAGVDVLVPVDLEAGPPPQRARFINANSMAPRYAALRESLRAQGLAVGRMAVSGERDSGEQLLTWVELVVPGRAPLWVGIHGALENPGLFTRGMLGLGLLVAVFLLAAAWLSSLVARPLQDLQRSVRSFAETGLRPPQVAVRGPVEVRQLMQQFEDFAAQRVEQDEARQIMLAGISHDLRSPLGRIRMAAEFLPDEAAIAVRRESIIRNAQLADQLVESFLLMVRCAAEPLEQRVDLLALVRGLLSSDDHQDVQLHLKAPGPFWLEPASAMLLQRSVVNLLENAHRYGKPPVHLSLALAAGQVLLTVRDHGPGIAAEQRETLLKPFYRGASDRGQPGTGLGLPIVERCVQRHAGQLRLGDAAPGLAVELRFNLAP